MPADSRWSAVRHLFVRHAEAFNKATRYEEASAIADKAGREIEELFASPARGEGDAPASIVIDDATRDAALSPETDQ